MEEENLHELEIVDGPFEVKLVRQGRVPVIHAHGHGHAPRPAATASDAPAKGEDLGNLLPVKAPLAGIFYRAPSPQAAPFIKEGESVIPEKTLCIIEAMKVLNEINAGVSGTVARILVENGKPVSAGQNLFLIEPA
ncbi:MAG: biotin/lipoyl-binding protein [Elusimicrobia bacterium]|nr:biotin/lipoyl-binding protein [Elusimicrobiota bacterium]